jgi:hypothetical protein
MATLRLVSRSREATTAPLRRTLDKTTSQRPALARLLRLPSATASGTAYRGLDHDLGRLHNGDR